MSDSVPYCLRHSLSSPPLVCRLTCIVFLVKFAHWPQPPPHTQQPSLPLPLHLTHPTYLCHQSVRRTVAVRTSGMPCTMEHWVAVLEREHQVTEEKRTRSLQKMEKHRERVESLEKAKEDLRKQLEKCAHSFT